MDSGSFFSLTKEMSRFIFMLKKGGSEGKIRSKVAYLNGFTNTEEKQIKVIVFEYLEQYKINSMDTLINSYDPLEQIIYEDEIRIKEIDVHPDLDMLLVILNTGRILQEKI